MLDEQAQKVRESLRAALIGWAETAGGGSDYTDNVPLQCLHTTVARGLAAIRPPSGRAKP